MLKKEDIIAMATALKMDVAKVTAAYEATEEMAVEFLPDSVKVFTPAEHTSREDTLKQRHEKAGMEIQIKNLKEKTGTEFDGKSDDKFIEAFKAKTLEGANVTEGAKVKELNTVIEGLRTNIITLTTEKDGLMKASECSKLDGMLLTMTIDKKPDHLDNDEWLTLIKSKNEIEEHDGQMIIKRDGKIVSNPTDLKPIPAKDALVSYIDERKWGKVEAAAGGVGGAGGRGAGDSKTNLTGISNMKQFNEHIAAKGMSPNGAEAQKELAAITEANPNFDFTAA